MSISAVTSEKMSKFTKHIHMEMVEQPSAQPVRFRYECEKRAATTIFGENTSTVSPTYPTIRVTGHTGVITVVVSCVTADHPYR